MDSAAVLQALSPLFEGLICTVCNETAKVPHSVMPCLHTFCHQCLLSQLQAPSAESHCPTCCAPYKLCDITPNIAWGRFSLAAQQVQSVLSSTGTKQPDSHAMPLQLLHMPPNVMEACTINAIHMPIIECQGGPVQPATHPEPGNTLANWLHKRVLNPKTGCLGSSHRQSDEVAIQKQDEMHLRALLPPFSAATDVCALEQEMFDIHEAIQELELCGRMAGSPTCTDQPPKGTVQPSKQADSNDIACIPVAQNSVSASKGKENQKPVKGLKQCEGAALFSDMAAWETATEHRHGAPAVHPPQSLEVLLPSSEQAAAGGGGAGLVQAIGPPELSDHTAPARASPSPQPARSKRQQRMRRSIIAPSSQAMHSAAAAVPELSMGPVAAASHRGHHAEHAMGVRSPIGKPALQPSSAVLQGTSASTAKLRSSEHGNTTTEERKALVGCHLLLTTPKGPVMCVVNKFISKNRDHEVRMPDGSERILKLDREQWHELPREALAEMPSGMRGRAGTSAHDRRSRSRSPFCAAPGLLTAPHFLGGRESEEVTRQAVQTAATPTGEAQAQAPASVPTSRSANRANRFQEAVLALVGLAEVPELAELDERVRAMASMRSSLFKVFEEVTSHTTHIVVHCDADGWALRRKWRYLEGCIHGCHLMRHTWLVDSLDAGCWLPEDAYHLQGDPVSRSICGVHAVTSTSGHGVLCVAGPQLQQGTLCGPARVRQRKLAGMGTALFAGLSFFVASSSYKQGDKADNFTRLVGAIKQGGGSLLNRPAKVAPLVADAVHVQHGLPYVVVLVAKGCTVKEANTVSTRWHVPAISEDWAKDCVSHFNILPVLSSYMISTVKTQKVR